MKKNFWKMAVVLMAMAAGLASCGGSDDDGVGPGGDSGLEPGQAVGSGTFTVDGTTYTISEVYVHHIIPWGDTYGYYEFTLTGEIDSNPMMDFYFEIPGEYLNATHNLTDKMVSSMYSTSIFINGMSYLTNMEDFKNGTICVLLDNAGNLTIETQGVANINDMSDPSDPDVSFSLYFTGKANVENTYYAEPPHVPYGDGIFTGTSLVIINGVPQTVDEVSVGYDPGVVGAYVIRFAINSYMNELTVRIPLDHLGNTYNLTDDLTGAGGTWAYIVIDGYYYYTDEGDFKSGTIKVSMDGEGNLNLFTKGVANDTYDDTDDDVNFEASFTGKGAVFK